MFCATAWAGFSAEDVPHIASVLSDLSGFNTISVDWPQVGFSPGGFETYVVWLRFTDAQVDPTARHVARQF